MTCICSWSSIYCGLLMVDRIKLFSSLQCDKAFATVFCLLGLYPIILVLTIVGYGSQCVGEVNDGGFSDPYAPKISCLKDGAANVE